jgi:hypothetical protein
MLDRNGGHGEAGQGGGHRGCGKKALHGISSNGLAGG